MSPAETISVKKRDGRIEQLNLEKLHKMVDAACEGITGVSASQIEINSHIQFQTGITTKQIQEILIKSAANLISEETPNYQYAAARLLVFALRKEVWKDITAPKLIDVVKHNIDKDVYDKDVLSYYNDEEWEILNSYIKHDRDLNFAYAGIQQVYDKYLVQDRVTGQKYETPQFAYILIAAILFKDYPAETKFSYIKKYYDAISQFKISLPTPVIAGVRTPTKQFASCVLIEVDDTLDSITASNSAVAKYVSRRAGIGLNVGKLRGLGAKIRGGEVKHTGLIPFLKWFQSAVGSCAQGGIRNGAATVYIPIWHWEIEDLIVLKNNQGTEDSRVRHLDYSVCISKLFYERYIQDGIITLFSPEDVPELYDRFGMSDFDELYLQAEKKRNVRKRIVSARELLNNIFSERVETGRIYIFNIDHANTHSSFKIPVRMSNLCAEVVLPTSPIEDLHDESGEIATCILSAINLGELKSLDDLENLCDLAVRALDALIDYQEYPMKAAENSTKNRRNLGVGYVNFAYYIAKHKYKLSDIEAKKLTHETTEAFQYYLLKASNFLAKEKGACPLFHETKYSSGILPIDTYKKELDGYANFAYKQDWEGLRESIVEHGLRNSTLTCIMPSESSSVVSNATNGIEPPREFLSVKKSKSTPLKILVPEYSRLKNQYELLWDFKEPTDYLIHCGIIQKFIDQSISVNTSYNPLHYPDNSIPLNVIVRDILLSYKLGLKALYYNNTYDMNKQDDEDNGCESGSCKI